MKYVDWNMGCGVSLMQSRKASGKGILAPFLKKCLGLLWQKLTWRIWWFIGSQTVTAHLWIRPSTHGNNKVVLGREVKLNNAVLNTRSGNIFIGDYTFFGHNCMVLTGRHDFTLTDGDRQYTVPTSGYDIEIGRGVWIASGVIIAGGAKIGDNSVICSGCVVSGEVPNNTIVKPAGNTMEQIRWW